MNYLSQAHTITNDVVIMARNYALLLAETGEANNGVNAMKKCAVFVRNKNTDMCIDYADLIFDIAAISLQIGNTETAKTHFLEAFSIYREILPQEDLTEKVQFAVKYLKQVGITSTPDFLTIPTSEQL